MLKLRLCRCWPENPFIDVVERDILNCYLRYLICRYSSFPRENNCTYPTLKCIWGVCMVDLVTHDTGNWPWALRERTFAQIPSISILYVVLFFSAEPYIWGDIYKSCDEFAATKLLRKLLRLGCFWCSESRRKLRKSGVSEVGSTPVGDTILFN